MRKGKTSFSDVVALKASRKLEAQRLGDPAPWSGLGMFGMVGWSIAVPTVVGALVGAYLDRHHASGYSWTLALLVAGLVVGCASAWYWVSQQASAAAPPPRDDHD
jgi:ATP synthase protein I